VAERVTQNEFAAALLQDRAAPAGLTTARGEADPRRFAVYRNNVMAGLTRALEQRFPVTVRLVGEQFFRGMAKSFIAGSRPRSPMLAEYGDDFPDFIAAFEAAATVPYLVDVARLEAAWSKAYHAAEATPIDPGALAGIDAQALPAARLRRHPAAALIGSAYPVGSIWAAHRSEVVEPVVRSGRESVLIVRPGADVGVHVLPPCDAPFAAAVLAGATLGEAAEAALAEDAGFDFGAALVGLAGLGAFSGVVAGDESCSR
jgi:hypothetical protein